MSWFSNAWAVVEQLPFVGAGVIDYLGGFKMLRGTKYFLPMTVAIAMSGCSPLPIHTTVDTLTNETSLRSSDYFDFSSFVSLSGLVPEHGVQLAFHQPQFYDSQPNSPSYSIGISPTRTFVTERKYSMTPSNGTENEKVIIAIRDGLEGVRLLSVQLATLQVRAESASTLIEAIGDKKADDGQAKTLKTLLGADVIDKDGKLDKVIVDKAFANIQAEITTIKAAIAKALAEVKAKAAQANVVVTRWAKERRTALNTALSEIFAFSGHGHEAKSGVLIYGDIRTATLHTGDDFVDMLKNASKHFLSFMKRAGITTFTIQAKHMAYVADMDLQKSIATQLSLTKAQLEDLSKTFSEVDLHFSMSYGVAMDISNSAVLSSSAVKTETRCFFPPALYTESARREIADADNYQMVYAVRAQIKASLIEAVRQSETAFSQIAKSKCKDKDNMFAPSGTDCQAALGHWLSSCMVKTDMNAQERMLQGSSADQFEGVIYELNDRDSVH